MPTLPDLATPTRRPTDDEHAPYYGRYISQVPDGDLLEMFDRETGTTRAMLDAIDEDAAGFRAAPGKWSRRQGLLHVADVERIVSYRALRVARCDTVALPGFEPDDHVGPAQADTRTWRSLVDEYAAVRQATIMLFRHLPAPAWSRRGTASGDPFTVHALAWLILGHDIHHRRLWRREA